MAKGAASLAVISLMVILNVRIAVGVCPVTADNGNHLNLGVHDIEQGEITGSRIVTNESGSTLSLTNTVATCGCTTAILTPATLAPNSTATLTVGLVGTRPGSALQTVDLYFGDSGCRFTMSGAFTTAGVVEPSALVLEGSETEPLSGEFEVLQHLQSAHGQLTTRVITSNSLYIVSPRADTTVNVYGGRDNLVALKTPYRVETTTSGKHLGRVTDTIDLEIQTFAHGQHLQSKLLSYRLQTEPKSNITIQPPSLVFFGQAEVRKSKSFSAIISGTDAVTSYSTTVGVVRPISTKSGEAEFELTLPDKVYQEPRPLRGTVSLYLSERRVDVPVLVLDN